MIRDFKVGEAVVASVALPLVRACEEFGTHIPKGTAGTVMNVGCYKGAPVIKVLFHFTRFTGGTLYGVFPTQLTR